MIDPSENAKSGLPFDFTKLKKLKSDFAKAQIAFSKEVLKAKDYGVTWQQMAKFSTVDAVKMYRAKTGSDLTTAMKKVREQND
jgi:hypothetical protein